MLPAHDSYIKSNRDQGLKGATLLSHDRPIVQGMTRWLPTTPAETKALPHEGASAQRGDASGDDGITL